MARRLRFEYPGALWHVMSRGNNRNLIYLDDRDRRRFLHYLAKYVVDAEWILHAYVLMSNHFHLLIETPKMTLSTGMHDLNTAYTGWFNHVHPHVGHVLQGRPDGVLIEKDAHLWEVMRYIVLNPVRAGMVRRPEDWLWSSYRATAGLTFPPPWLEVDATLRKFHPDDDRIARDLYRDFVAAPSDPRSIWERVRGGVFLGSDRFISTVKDLVRGAAEKPPLQRIDVETRLSRLEEGLGDERCAELRIRGRSESRLAFILVARRCHATLRTIGERVDLTPSQVRRLALEAEEKRLRDATFSGFVEALLKRTVH